MEATVTYCKLDLDLVDLAVTISTQEYCGGWPCFYISLAFIGVVTVTLARVVGRDGRMVVSDFPQS